MDLSWIFPTDFSLTRETEKEEDSDEEETWEAPHF